MNTDRSRNESTNDPIMCKNNCGFCGSIANENYCSKCYREHLKNKSKLLNLNNSLSKDNNTSSKGEEAQSKDVVDPVDSTNETQTLDKSEALNLSNVGTLSCEKEDASTPDLKYDSNELLEHKDAKDLNKDKKTDREKCHTCRKLVGLLGFSCRCGNTFCSLHRQSNIHNCDFDYKNYNKLQLERKTVKIVPNKLEKI